MSLRDNETWNNVYNVLTGNYKLSDILQFISKNVDRLEINYVDTPLLNQNTYYVNDNKIQECGFVSRDSLELEIKKTLEILK